MQLNSLSLRKKSADPGLFSLILELQWFRCQQDSKVEGVYYVDYFGPLRTNHRHCIRKDISNHREAVIIMACWMNIFHSKCVNSFYLPRLIKFGFLSWFFLAFYVVQTCFRSIWSRGSICTSDKNSSFVVVVVLYQKKRKSNISLIWRRRRFFVLIWYHRVKEFEVQ